MNITYRNEGNILIPNLTVPKSPQKPIGVYGRMRQIFLKTYHRSKIIIESQGWKTVSSDTQQALSIPATEETDSRFKHQRLYQALESLSEKEKASIVLHYFEDSSIKEISSILKIPQGTVKYYLSTGRNHLKSILQ